MATSTVGRAKKATQVTTTTVTAEVKYGLDVDGLDWPSDGTGWTEAHLRVSRGDQELFFSGAQRTLFNGPESLVTFTWTVEGQLTGDVRVEILADNLVLDTGLDEFVYDPGNNDVPTTAGFVGEPTDSDLWNASTNVSSQVNDGRVPVVWSGTTVTCH